MAFPEKLLLLIDFSGFITRTKSGKHRLDGDHEDDGEIWREDIPVEIVNFFETDSARIALISIGREITP